MPAVNLANIYAQARNALQVSEDELPDEALALDTQDEIDRLFTDYPCLTDGAGGTRSSLTAIELRAFERAAGCFVAATYITSPAGKNLAAALTEVKIGPVTERYGSGMTTADIGADCRTKAGQALVRIGCIGDPAAAARRLAFSGRSVAYGEPDTLIEQAFGADEE